MAYNKSRRNKVYDYSYTIEYDMDSCLYTDSSYVTDQYTSIIRPYANNAKIVYNFTAYAMDHHAIEDLCNFIKSLPSVISYTLVQSCFVSYQLDFTLEGIYGIKVKDFMDEANRKAEIEHFYSYINTKPMFPNWFPERRNGKEIEQNMQKFTPKKVIYSGGKTIVIWPDNSKTIVSCGDGDQYDEYAGFCAALAKKIFGATSSAKRVMNANKVVNAPKELAQKEEFDYEVVKHQVTENLKNALRECLNSISFMDFQKKIAELTSKAFDSGIDISKEADKND